jgi:tellurite resistance protein
MPNPHRSYQSVLLDAIFYEQDKHLREAFRKRLEKMERREQLTQVSGIRDEAVLDRFIELGITAETLAALELVPLVFVAWADGSVRAEEREVIITLAKSAGIEPQDGRYPLLEHWLKRRPGPEMLEAWKHYVQELRRQLDAKEAEELRRELLDRAYSVARAAGGFLGFGDKMSAAERSMLAKLEEVFA